MKTKYKCAICAIIKDEQRYLQEWIEHCLSIGFRDIFLYEDKGSVSHSQITDKYDNVYLSLYSEEMRLDAYREKDWKQVGLFHYFIEKYKKQYDWVAFIDPDEYIRFEDGYSLNTLCDDFKECRGVYLMYKMYGANGHVNRPEGGVVESYGNSEPMPYMKWKTNHKSFVNLSFDDISFTSVHHVRCGVYTDFNNRRHNSYEHPEKDLCYKKAWIDHYYTKSWEDWQERFTKKGDVVFGNRMITDFFEYNRDMFHTLLGKKKLVKLKLHDRMCNQLFIISAALSKYPDSVICVCGKVNKDAKMLLNYNAIMWKEWNGEKCEFIPDGYYQDAKDHDESILQDNIRLPNPRKVYDFVIHVRREDYLKHLDKYYVLTKEYIERMYEKYYKRGSIAIVSTPDGIEWAKEQSFNFDFDCVSGSPIEDLSVIASAKTVICSGSSFSVMGCMLNRNKDKVCVIHKPYDKISDEHDCIIPSYFKTEIL